MSLSEHRRILDIRLEVLAALLMSFCQDDWMFFNEGDNETGQKRTH